jgi:hypothetical protein
MMPVAPVWAKARLRAQGGLVWQMRGRKSGRSRQQGIKEQCVQAFLNPKVKNPDYKTYQTCHGQFEKFFFGALRQIIFIEGLWKKVFAAFGSRIFCLETRHFHDFAKRNRENGASLKI